MIKVTGLDKYYNKGKKSEHHVLDSVDVEFASTGLVCILGESGSGKTTLLNTIGGLDTFSRGTLQYDEVKVHKYEPRVIEQIRNEQFGYIFQNYYLLQDYTVWYNVKIALNTFESSEEEKDARVNYVLEKLEISKYKKKLVSQLSGGQQQRVSIARALVKSPKIILADEPTGNLDEENTIRTMSILKHISKECLVIVVSHERRIANFFADRIIEIQDGKIRRDYRNENHSAYERMDDGNIYLKDLEENILEDKNNISIKLYGERHSEEPIRLNIAWKNGKLYIQNLENYDILLAGEEVGCEMLDSHKPNVEISRVEQFDFGLPELIQGKRAKLSVREIWKLALENIRLMGKKQAFVVMTLFISALLMTITLANFTNSYFFNKREVLKEDSHYVEVHIQPAYDKTEEELTNAFRKYCDEYLFARYEEGIFRCNGGKLHMYYDGFRQLQSTGVDFEDFSYVSVEHLKEKELVYGRMPQNLNEIVVDKWLIEKFLDSENAFHTLFPTIKDFIGTKLVSAVTEDSFDIVGICDKEEPSIYINQNKAMGLAINGYRIASQQQLQEVYTKGYEDVSLLDTQILISDAQEEYYRIRDVKTITLTNGREYEIAGFFPGELGVDYVLSSNACKTIRNDYIIQGGGCLVYTDNAEKVIKELKDGAKDYREDFVLTALSKNKIQMKTFEEQREDSVNSRNLIAVSVFLVALFVIYFTVKSNVTSRIEELTVYRLIGIEKKSILNVYRLEMILVTSYTVLPTILLTTGVIKFIASIPSLEIGLQFPWWSSFLLIMVFYLLNLLISTIPVRGILAKPPAVLAVKE